MKRSTSILKCGVILLLAAAAGMGCPGSDVPTKPSTTVDPNAPPPPTPEELARQAITELGLDQPLPPPGSRLIGSVRSTMLSQFAQKHTQLSATPEGQIALKQVQAALEQKIDAYNSGGYWEYVIAYAEAYKTFQPDSRKYLQAVEKAQIELRKPVVTVHGLPAVDGYQVALLKIYVPLDSKTYDERLSVGEDAHGVKFLEVFGNGRGIRWEFMETGQRFIAYLPSAK